MFSPRNCDTNRVRLRLKIQSAKWRPAMHRCTKKDYPMPVFLLDVIYVAIGIAAFAITALYLGACDKL